MSIIDIARAANVSTATVSRVLNETGGYSEETKQRVLDIVSKYEYTPNVSAISLRTSRSFCIGVIVPDISNEFFARIIRELEAFYLTKNYTLLICNTNEDIDLEKIQVNNLLKQNVDAIIYISGQDEIGEIKNVNNLPVVYIDRSPKGAKNLILSDNVNGGYLATKLLIEKGCKKILFIRDSRNVSTVVERRVGYLKALEENSLIFDPNLEIQTKVDYNKAKLTVDTLLREKGLFFDGVFCSCDLIAVGCTHAILNRGYSIPNDVKIVGFDNISLSNFCNPPLTTVTQDVKNLAIESAKTVLRLIEGKEEGRNRKVISISIEERGTT